MHHRKPYIVVADLLVVLAFSSVILSILINAQVLAPTSQKQRNKIMDNPERELNLFWFVEIAKKKKVDYQHAIDTLTEEMAIKQLTLQAHNLARILDVRYRKMGRADILFMIGVITFALLAVTKLFGP